MNKKLELFILLLLIGLLPTLASEGCQDTMHQGYGVKRSFSHISQARHDVGANFLLDLPEEMHFQILAQDPSVCVSYALVNKALHKICVGFVKSTKTISMTCPLSLIEFSKCLISGNIYNADPQYYRLFTKIYYSNITHLTWALTASTRILISHKLITTHALDSYHLPMSTNASPELDYSRTDFLGNTQEVLVNSDQADYYLFNSFTSLLNFSGLTRLTLTNCTIDWPSQVRVFHSLDQLQILDIQGAVNYECLPTFLSLSKLAELSLDLAKAEPAGYKNVYCSLPEGRKATYRHGYVSEEYTKSYFLNDRISPFIKKFTWHDVTSVTLDHWTSRMYWLQQFQRHLSQNHTLELVVFKGFEGTSKLSSFLQQVSDPNLKRTIKVVDFRINETTSDTLIQETLDDGIGSDSDEEMMGLLQSFK